MVKEEFPSLKDLVKNNTVHMTSYRDGNFYFNLHYKFGEGVIDGDDIYQFTVPLDDIKGATVVTNDKALLYMRWIRRALEEGTLIKT